MNDVRCISPQYFSTRNLPPLAWSPTPAIYPLQVYGFQYTQGETVLFVPGINHFFLIVQLHAYIMTYLIVHI